MAQPDDFSPHVRDGAWTLLQSVPSDCSTSLDNPGETPCQFQVVVDDTRDAGGSPTDLFLWSMAWPRGGHGTVCVALGQEAPLEVRRGPPGSRSRLRTGCHWAAASFGSGKVFRSTDRQFRVGCIY